MWLVFFALTGAYSQEAPKNVTPWLPVAIDTTPIDIEHVDTPLKRQLGALFSISTQQGSLTEIEYGITNALAAHLSRFKGHENDSLEFALRFRVIQKYRIQVGVFTGAERDGLERSTQPLVGLLGSYQVSQKGSLFGQWELEELCSIPKMKFGLGYGHSLGQRAGALVGVSLNDLNFRGSLGQWSRAVVIRLGLDLLLDRKKRVRLGVGWGRSLCDGENQIYLGLRYH